MRSIFRIAKLELSTLFYSPIAWFLAIVFLIQAGLSYTGNLQRSISFQELSSHTQSFGSLTFNMFLNPFTGMFTGIISKIYLYLPLLTMGLISREVSSGTIKLLYSSPIKVHEIILGKFLSMAVYSLLLTAILSIFVISACFNVPHADVGLMMSALFGIFLLLLTYSAIGLFMSCLTEYQIVAAISTLVIFAILDYVGRLWQGIDFIRNLSYFFSISGRTSRMLLGLIDSRDVVYFLTITAMFLAFSMVKLKGDRTTKSRFAIASQYVIVAILAFTVGYLSSIPVFIGYFDATVNKTNTLTPNTQKVIAQLDAEPMEVTMYANLLDRNFYICSPDRRNDDLNRWATYLRFKPNIKLNYVYYYAAPLGPKANFAKNFPGRTPEQMARKYAETYGIDFEKLKSAQEMDKIIDLKPELYRCVMQVKYQGKKTFLRMFDDIDVVPSEAEITAAFKRLTVPLPKIAFLQGEFERSITKLGDNDYGALSNDITFRSALINQGFDVSSLSLNTQEIPDDLSALVIGDPRTDFSPSVSAKINAYIAKGGNLLIAGESDKKSALAPILRPLGVSMMDGTLLQTNANNSINQVKMLLTKSAAMLSGRLAQAFADSIGVEMPGVSGLSYEKNAAYTIKPLLLTDGKTTWNKKGKLALDSAEVVYSSANGDDRSEVSPLLALTRNVNGKQQRIIVAGDADFLTAAASNGTNKINFTFNTQLFRWFTYGQFPIDTTRPKAKDTKIIVSRSGLTALKIFLLGVLPGLLSIFGAWLLIRRKRK